LSAISARRIATAGSDACCAIQMPATRPAAASVCASTITVFSIVDRQRGSTTLGRERGLAIEASAGTVHVSGRSTPCSRSSPASSGNATAVDNIVVIAVMTIAGPPSRLPATNTRAGVVRPCCLKNCSERCSSVVNSRVRSLSSQGRLPALPGSRSRRCATGIPLRTNENEPRPSRKSSTPTVSSAVVASPANTTSLAVMRRRTKPAATSPRSRPSTIVFGAMQ
jgi:hypothetical protein